MHYCRRVSPRLARNAAKLRVSALERRTYSSKPNIFSNLSETDTSSFAAFCTSLGETRLRYSDAVQFAHSLGETRLHQPRGLLALDTMWRIGRAGPVGSAALDEESDHFRELTGSVSSPESSPTCS